MRITLLLLGGVGLFLLGMSMMTDGLKLAGGEALREILRSWTRTRWRGLAAGALITGIVQSSSAVTIATIGFVNAGLLTLTQAIWVLFGANVGTTMTSWLVAMVGLKVDVAGFALPLIGLGMLARLVAGKRQRLAGLGLAVAGFGAFFLGIDVLKDGFEGLVPQFAAIGLAGRSAMAPLLFTAFGALLTVLTQSSSAAVAIALAANAGGGIPLELAAGAVIGANIGTTSTALLAAIGATPAARRVAAAHIAFNLCAAGVALVILMPLLAASAAIAQVFGAGANETVSLAVFHTFFNCLGVALIWPLAPRLVRRLQSMFVTAEETQGLAPHLDATLAEVPALALRGLVIETMQMQNLAFDLARQRIAGLPGSAGDGRHGGLLQFGQAIRDFIARLSRQPLPRDVVEALPDVIRAVQHLEDVAAISAGLADDGRPPPHTLAGPAWERLVSGTRSTLAETSAFDDERLPGEVEDAYQDIKKELLAAAATGRLPVHVMEAALLRARRLRRLAEAACKARRRLAPWTPLARDAVDPKLATAGDGSDRAS